MAALHDPDGPSDHRESPASACRDLADCLAAGRSDWADLACADRLDLFRLDDGGLSDWLDRIVCITDRSIWLGADPSGAFAKMSADR